MEFVGEIFAEDIGVSRNLRVKNSQEFLDCLTIQMVTTA